MVQKTSHRGVYSGNTLRASNSRYSRRYHSQACIVSRFRPELLQKLDGGADTRLQAVDDPKTTHNFALDVPLSLNKQARWLLPTALIRQIRNDNVADSGLTLSLLERHKLKRPASCVSFHSNRGDVKRIQPKNGRYFGFHFPTSDGKSRRAQRRERREMLLEELKNNKAGKLVGNTVTVFTEQGRAKRNMEIGESEVRYEVYYPSPASSSISHNPKYIKQDIDGTFGDSEEHVQHGKPKKQHRGKRRKRITLKDLDDWELTPTAYPSQPSDTHAVPNSVDQDTLTRLDVQDERNPTECLLSSLIEKAQQLQNFKGFSKRRRKNSKSFVLQEEDDKSHIVYLSDTQAHPTRDETFEEKTEKVAPSSQHPVSPIPPESTRVLLSKEDVKAGSLKDCFRESYIEVGCSPRKFVLDVTSSVRELLKKQGVQARVAEMTEEALSYLICVHDGFYNDEYDVYRVMLNTKLHNGLLAVEIDSQDQQDLFRGTVLNLISKTMDFMQGLVIALKDKRHFPVFLEGKPTKVLHRHLSKHLGSSKAYTPSLDRMFQMGSAVADNDVKMPAMSDLLQEGPVFCDVCYDDVSPLTFGSAPSTSLLTCQHHVCDSCWSQHIHVRLHEGFVRVTCPGYDCQEEVRMGVLLSVAPLDTVDKLLQRQEEVRIGASQTDKWCPNESCGRVISFQPSTSSSSSSPGGDRQLQQDVVCACGTHVCFLCLMPAHWPASCTQAEHYRNDLSSATFPDRLAEVHDDFKADEEAKRKRELEKKSTMLVEGKHCPRCKTFVFKNGGCPQMTCRCGQLFCWFCAKPGYSHPDRRGCVDVNREKELTTTIVVHHLQNLEHPDETKKPQQSSSGNRRKRMSLMERAVEHRHHRENKQNSSRAITTLAKAVATASAKNKVLTQHITRACSAAFPSTSTGSKHTPTTASSKHPSHSPSTVLETVSTFLKNAAHSKQELLEVVEYSLVLMKDLPDSLLRRRALRVCEDLGAFCSFSQSIFDVWGQSDSSPASLQEAVKAVLRLAEIQGWIHAALDTHIVTIRKLRGLSFSEQ